MVLAVLAILPAITAAFVLGNARGVESLIALQLWLAFFCAGECHRGDRAELLSIQTDTHQIGQAGLIRPQR